MENEDSDVPEHRRSRLKTQEACVGNLYKIESHCLGPKMRNQDPRGRRGQPLQVREPLPGAQDEESRQRPAWATSTSLRATARGPRCGIKNQEAGVGNLHKFKSHCPGPKMRNQDECRRGQPLQVREPLPGVEDEESRRRPAWATSTSPRATARGPR